MKYNYHTLKNLSIKARNKSDTAKKLGISRPTLDLWLKKFKRDEQLIQEECGQELLHLRHGLELKGIDPEDIVTHSKKYFTVGANTKVT